MCHSSGTSVLASRSPTQRAPDWWESARFQAVCVAWSGFRQNGVVSSRPPAGNACRWADYLSAVDVKYKQEQSK